MKYRVTATTEPVAKKKKPILPAIFPSGLGLILFVLLAPFLVIGLVTAGLLVGDDEIDEPAEKRVGRDDVTLRMKGGAGVWRHRRRQQTLSLG